MSLHSMMFQPSIHTPIPTLLPTPTPTPIPSLSTPTPTISKLSTLLDTNFTTATVQSKPFLLYKGSSTPEREEALKIYPVTSNYNYTTLSLSLSSADESSRASSVSFDVTSTSTTLSSEDDSDRETTSSTNTTNNTTADDKKYKCSHANCKYKGTFLSKDYLRRHVREQHRNSREHTCLGFQATGEKWGCSKKFSRPYQLVNHWKGQRSLKRCGVPESELRRAGAL